MDKNKGKSGEFGFIGQIRERFAPLLPQGTVGIGDDCAVIPTGGGESLVVTTDMLIENVHFVLEKIAPAELGYKSLAVNLSDVAAMGAEPSGSFLSIGLPPHIGEEWKKSFLEGYEKLSKQHNVPLLGGDTTASEKIVINITAIGKAPDGSIKMREGAKPGDLICVTGNLGDSVAGLRLLLQNDRFTADEAALVKAHRLPKPYVKEGRWLGGQSPVHAMMDVSDGIASDLIHILEASGLSAEVELADLPLSESFKNVCGQYGWNQEELAVSGGEDYVLLLTAAPRDFDRMNEAYTNTFGRALTVIGRIGEGEPRISWRRNGKLVEADWKGFTHF